MLFKLAHIDVVTLSASAWVQTRTDRLDLCKIHIEMERNMTETGLWIFLICLLVVVIIATVVAVVSAVSGATAAIVDDEESEEE